MIFLLLFISSLAAAIGQLLLKIGADGCLLLAEFINLKVISGLSLYALSTILWIFCLSRLKLTVVYVFTVVTFVLVYLLSFFFLKEKINLYGIGGIILVLLGLYFIAVKGTV